MKSVELTVVNDASLLGGSGGVDSLEPSAHELAHFELLGGGGEKGVGDVVCEGLQLLGRKNVSESRSVGHTTSDGSCKVTVDPRDQRSRTDKLDDVDLSLGVAGDSSGQQGDSGDSGESCMSGRVGASSSEGCGDSREGTLGCRGLATDLVVLALEEDTQADWNTGNTQEILRLTGSLNSQQ